MNKRVRNKPYHSLGKVKQAIKDGEYDIDEDLLKEADDAFGWSIEDITNALLKLKAIRFTSSKRYFTDPALWVDHYRANRLLRENEYIHFHFEDGLLIIGNLKRR